MRWLAGADWPARQTSALEEVALQNACPVHARAAVQGGTCGPPR